MPPAKFETPVRLGKSQCSGIVMSNPNENAHTADRGALSKLTCLPRWRENLLISFCEKVEKMPIDPETNVVREVVGIFSRPEDLQSAIDELMSSGFHRAELSLLASEQAVEEKLGHRYAKVRALADDPTVPRAAYVSTEAIGDAQGGVIGGLMYVGALAAAGAIVVSGGMLATAIAAAALAGGASGLIGSILAKWIGNQHARYLQEQLEHGGLLLWVRTRDDEREKSAVEILRRNSSSDVHVHALPVEAQKGLA
jgi:hypothetical protein